MSRWSGITGALLGALIVAGCTTGDQADVGFGIEAPGRYMVGDSFTFDNPQETWTVVSIEGERVYWRSDRGDEHVTGHDPLMPALEWKFVGKGGGRREFTDVKGSLFPLKKGNILTYTSNVENWTIKDGVRQQPQSWQYNWSCNVAGTERMEVPAGGFDTYKVVCGRYKPSEIEFFYAPRIGYFVVMRIDDPASEGTVVRNLLSFSRVALGGEPMAVLPPPPPPPPPPAPPPPEPARELPPPPVKPIGPQTGSGPRVVLGAFSSEGNAARGWRIFMDKNNDLLGGLDPVISPVSFRGQGTLFRLATERLESEGVARSLCDKLRARGLECIVSMK
ncbi:MAG: SPOR domain-containing protein [Rhodospirillales bacterium]|nr:MAG: SPOR domain-containing protein [Rhodospirillales bacterium]